MQPVFLDSDDEIRLAVLAALASDQRMARASLRVGVLNGIVHVAGKVGTLEDRLAAETLASRVPGVRGVVNRIEAPGAPSPARTINLNLGSQE